MGSGATLSRASLQRQLPLKLEALPVLPAIVSRLLRVDHAAPDAFEITELIVGGDPPLAARLLRHANSSAFSGVVPTSTLQGALSRVGIGQVLGMVDALGTSQYLTEPTEGQIRLWAHSLQTAYGARLIAQEAHVDVDPELAYLCGLLHDLGRFVLFGKNPEETLSIPGRGAAPAAIVQAERSDHGLDHADVGWLACQYWKLPDPVAFACRDHHAADTARCQSPTSVPDGLMQVIQLADRLSLVIQHVNGFLQASPRVQIATLERRCLHGVTTFDFLTTETLVGVAGTVALRTEEALSMLGLR